MADIDRKGGMEKHGENPLRVLEPGSKIQKLGSNAVMLGSADTTLQLDAEDRHVGPPYGRPRGGC